MNRRSLAASVLIVAALFVFVSMPSLARSPGAHGETPPPPGASYILTPPPVLTITPTIIPTIPPTLWYPVLDKRLWLPWMARGRVN